MNKKRLDEIIRVNQAGEYGAKWIYKGQLAILGKSLEIEHMQDQEDVHLAYFNNSIIEQKARPTVMQPLWAVGGFCLGAISALMGEKTAHACTIAVESVINDHYQAQIEELSDSEEHKDLREHIIKFQAEEMEHHDSSIKAGGLESSVYHPLSFFVRAISKMAIKISEKI
jgi:3-demethoxyubiquinol 3-hydroxylase